MPFVLSHMEVEDAVEFATLDDVTISGVPFAQAMGVKAAKQGKTRKQWVEENVTKALGLANPDDIWLKVVDSATGVMIAAANWVIVQHGSTVEKTTVPLATKAESTTSGPPSQEKTVFDETRAAWLEFQSSKFPDQPYQLLRILITHPQWQRKGAGGSLVDWGCKKADAEGVLCVLNASEEGLPLYLKYGFELVFNAAIDLRPYGVDATEVRRGMIRRPRKTVQ